MRITDTQTYDPNLASSHPIALQRAPDIVTTIPEKLPICTPGKSSVLFCTLGTEEYTALYPSLFYSGTQEHMTQCSHNI
jgi:hypothetical protein